MTHDTFQSIIFDKPFGVSPLRVWPCVISFVPFTPKNTRAASHCNNRNYIWDTTFLCFVSEDVGRCVQCQHYSPRVSTCFILCMCYMKGSALSCKIKSLEMVEDEYQVMIILHSFSNCFILSTCCVHKQLNTLIECLSDTKVTIASFPMSR